MVFNTPVNILYFISRQFQNGGENESGKPKLPTFGSRTDKMFHYVLFQVSSLALKITYILEKCYRLTTLYITVKHLVLKCHSILKPQINMFTVYTYITELTA